MNVCDPDKPIVLAQVNQCCLKPSEVGEYVKDKVHVKFNAWFMEQMRGGVERLIQQQEVQPSAVWCLETTTESRVM